MRGIAWSSSRTLHRYLHQPHHLCHQCGRSPCTGAARLSFSQRASHARPLGSRADRMNRRAPGLVPPRLLLPGQVDAPAGPAYSGDVCVRRRERRTPLMRQPRRLRASADLLASYPEHLVRGLRLLLGDHGAADRHDEGDDAVDPLGGLVIGERALDLELSTSRLSTARSGVLRSPSCR